MAVKTDEELKEYYEENDYPNEEEFGHLIDSKWSKTQTIPISDITIGEQELTYAATTVWDVADKGTNARVLLTGNTTIDLQNMQVGQFCHLTVKQDATGSRTLAAPSGHLVGYTTAGAIVLDPNADALTSVSIYRSDYGYLWLINKPFSLVP